jgi:hypothetical protein
MNIPLECRLWSFVSAVMSQTPEVDFCLQERKTYPNSFAVVESGTIKNISKTVTWSARWFGSPECSLAAGSTLVRQ